MQNSNKKDATPRNTKTVGGQIPQELYWRFKQIQAMRQETSTQALEVAIRLYCEVIQENNK